MVLHFTAVSHRVDVRFTTYGSENPNDRQRAYLAGHIQRGPEARAEMRSIPYQPFQQRPKASERRWLEYSEALPEIQKPASRLYTAIKKAAPIDQGTGSTFRALADRGLIQVEEREYNIHGQRTPYIRLTTAVRKLVRAWTGARPTKRHRQARCASGTGAPWRRPTLPVTTASRAAMATTPISAGTPCCGCAITSGARSSKSTG
jgi:hypothetical protein